jgi:transposase
MSVVDIKLPDKITPKMHKAIGLYMEGKSFVAIGKEIGTTASTVNRWIERDDVQAYCRSLLKAQIPAMVAAALKVLSEMVANGSGWLKLNAANAILGKYGDMAADQSVQKIVIEVAGAPVLGSPTGMTLIGNGEDDGGGSVQ